MNSILSSPMNKQALEDIARKESDAFFSKSNSDIAISVAKDYGYTTLIANAAVLGFGYVTGLINESYEAALAMTLTNAPVQLTVAIEEISDLVKAKKNPNLRKQQEAKEFVKKSDQVMVSEFAERRIEDSVSNAVKYGFLFSATSLIMNAFGADIDVRPILASGVAYGILKTIDDYLTGSDLQEKILDYSARHRK